MAYTKQTWADLPSKTTPINAERLTHIEDGIYNAAATADNAASTAGSLASRVGIAEGKITNLEQQKVDKETGKGLSENDFTNTLKSKLDGIASGAEVNVQSDWDEADSSSDAFILNKPTLGTASTKNSTSVVTESSDLVESGAVKDIVGWGNKNQLKLTLTEIKAVNGYATWSGNTMSYNGGSITFIEMDGFVTGISINGTVTSDFNVRLTNTDNLGYQGKMLNGTVDTSKEYLFAYDEVLPSSVSDTGNGVTIPDTFTRYRIILGVKAVAHNEVIYPMVSKDGGAYEPYHASVEESLAEKCDNTVIAPVENGTTASQAYAVGEHFIRDGAFCTCKQAISQGGSFTLNTNYTAGDVADNILKKVTFSGTTNASGNMVLVSGEMINIISVVMDGTEQIALPYISQYGNTSIHVLSSTMNALTNTSVSGTYYYI